MPTKIPARAVLPALKPLAAMLLLAACAHGRHVLAASPVTSCADDGGFDTLRHAVLTANSGDTIDLGNLDCGKITLLNGEIAVALQDLTIKGPGLGRLTIDGNAAGRVFAHTGSGTLTIADVTVANGVRAADPALGGCIYSAANVALARAKVSSCKALGQTLAAGGGVAALQDVTVDSSVLSGNRAEASVGRPQDVSAGGGATLSGFSGTATFINSVVTGNVVDAASGMVEGGGIHGGRTIVLNSTIGGNTATVDGVAQDRYGVGGGLTASYSLFMMGSTLDHNQADIAGGAAVGASAQFASIGSSTVSGNMATRAVGGVFSVAPLSMASSTVAFNIGGANGAGGLAVGAGSVALQSAIIADNLPSDFDGGAAISGSHNLVKTVGANAAALPMDTLRVDPQLGPLAYNGGTTRTHALLPGSPAIDAGALPAIDADSSPASLETDQRGGVYARSVGAAPDIGAFELDTDRIFSDGFSP